MRSLVLLLFGLGCGWAAFVWILALTPFGILDPTYQYGVKDTLESLAATALALTGYWIWFGWLYRGWTGRYLWPRARFFWGLSALHHAGWIALISGLRRDWLDFALHDWFGRVVFVWLLANIAIAIVLVVLGDDTPGEKKDSDDEASVNLVVKGAPVRLR